MTASAPRWPGADVVFAVSGSRMASRAMIVEGDLATIARLSRDAVALVRR